MTEEQAKSYLWCPKAIVGMPAGGGAVNRSVYGKPSPGTNCLASGCAYWRWHGPRTDVHESLWHGYCGAAGPPGEPG